MSNWSRISVTLPILHAFIRQHIDNKMKELGLEYHNLDHVDSIYEFYELTNIAYSEELDVSTLLFMEALGSRVKGNIEQAPQHVQFF